MLHSPFAAAFAPGARLAHGSDGVIMMRNHLVGALAVPTGRIVVADPLTTDFDELPTPLGRLAPIGVFPVELAIARFDNNDERVACARVRFADGPALRWELAGLDEPPSLDVESSAYGVDTGMGCFADATARGQVDDTSAAAWLAAIDARRVDTWTWHVVDLGGANVVMFSSGWGDGFYPSYWGLDAADNLVELVTDFEVLLDPVHERIELPLPLPRGRLVHPRLSAHQITLRRPLLSRGAAIVRGDKVHKMELSDGSPVAAKHTLRGTRWTWKPPAPDTRLYLCVVVGMKPCDLLPPNAAP